MSEPPIIHPSFSFDLTLVCAALALDPLLGYPTLLYRLIRHPVVWIGALIGWLDRHGNDAHASSVERRVMGVAAVCALILLTVGPAILLQSALQGRVSGQLVLAVIASTLLAQRSLWQHVIAVANSLRDDGLAGGRRAVAKIVGRNPDTLDEAGIVRAAIESLAENFSDGIVASALWCAAFGLPGLVFYKAINTADSMIGHRTKRHEAFGWAAARLDDLINLPASRLTAFWLLLAALCHGADVSGAWRAIWRDAKRHRSPNAGWPEAAMAGALGLRLAGPRVYGDVRVDDGWMGDGRPEATEADLRRALQLYRTACLLQFCAVTLALGFILRG